MLENDVSVLSIRGENGLEKDYLIICKFSVGTRDYIALIPQDSPESVIEVFRCISINASNIQIHSIMSDIELSDVKREFERIMQNEYTNLMEQEQSDSLTITVTDSNGIERLCEIIQTFTYSGEDFIALMPYGNDESPTIQLFKYHASLRPDGFQNLYLEEISEEMYFEVRDYFMSTLEENLLS